MSASYLDLHLEINNEGRLKTKINDKSDDFTFPIVSIPCICSNIPESPAYGVYLSQLIRILELVPNIVIVLDRAQLLT